jgi:hypothetical protein
MAKRNERLSRVVAPHHWQHLTGAMEYARQVDGDHVVVLGNLQANLAPRL